MGKQYLEPRDHLIDQTPLRGAKPFKKLNLSRIGTAIRWKRARLGLPQKKLLYMICGAGNIPMCDKTLSDLERGIIKDISLKKLHTIVQAIGLDFCELINAAEIDEQ